MLVYPHSTSYYGDCFARIGVLKPQLSGSNLFYFQRRTNNSPEDEHTASLMKYETVLPVTSQICPLKTYLKLPSSASINPITSKIHRYF